MPSNQPSFVLGYHGCDRAVARRVIEGDVALARSENRYDWLGHGVYFWENDPGRAYDWARKSSRVQEPWVVGAVVDLGNCLNLLETASVDLVVDAYALLRGSTANAGDLPRNEPAYPQDLDRVKRYRDCAVIEATHRLAHREGLAPFDTVRCMFPEGEPAYEGGGVLRRSHIQICVRNRGVICGYFYPTDPETGDLIDWSAARDSMS